MRTPETKANTSPRDRLQVALLASKSILSEICVEATDTKDNAEEMPELLEVVDLASGDLAEHG